LGDEMLEAPSNHHNFVGAFTIDLALEKKFKTLAVR
jgi:hypothetical protein|tara:strand:- start:1318 stop:1425 length:108 start_codon:yes stop_codon:yes gene_type:complete